MRSDGGMAIDTRLAAIAGVHRSIRSLDPAEGAFAGELVTDGERVRVRVSAAFLHGAVVWEHCGADHIAAPVDLIRHADGIDVLLPWCAERAEAFIGRRAAADAPLALGEIVTLAGSVLRGLDELGCVELPGSWWLDDDGRPVVVLDGPDDVILSSRKLLTGLRSATTDRVLARVLADIETALADPRAARTQLAKWEAELIDRAAPQPLERDIYASERVRDIVARGAVPRTAETLRPRRRRSALMSAVETAAARLDDLRDRMRRMVRSVSPLRSRRDGGDSRSGTPTRRGPRRPLLVGAAAAAAVIVGGLLWPQVESDPSAVAQDGGRRPATVQTSTQPQEAGKAAPDASAAPAASPAPSESAPSADDPVAAASTLLAAIADCARQDDTTCAAAVVDDAVIASIGDPSADDAVELVESYGDIAVIRRRPAAGAGEQILVLVRTDDEWLVRDAYDVADQPSG